MFIILNSSRTSKKNNVEPEKNQEALPILFTNNALKWGLWGLEPLQDKKNTLLPLLEMKEANNEAT